MATLTAVMIGEDIGEAYARIWPEPVRGSELYSQPR
jgi:hypothetical protein